MTDEGRSFTNMESSEGEILLYQRFVFATFAYFNSMLDLDPIVQLKDIKKEFYVQQMTNEHVIDNFMCQLNWAKGCPGA